MSNNINSIVLINSKNLFYEDFDSGSSIGKYVTSSSNWKIDNCKLINNDTQFNNVKDRIDFFGDFPETCSLELKFRLNDFNNPESFFIVQFFTKENYARRTLGDGLGILIKPGDISKQSNLSLIECKNEKINYLSEKKNFSFDRNDYHTLRIDFRKKRVVAFIDDELLICYDYPLQKRLFQRLSGGWGLIKGLTKIEIEYLHVYSDKSSKLAIGNLDADSIVEFLDSQKNVVISVPSINGMVKIDLENSIFMGFIRIRNAKGEIINVSSITKIMGGDSYKFMTIDLDHWIKETEQKLLSDTFWREKNDMGGLISRIGDPAIFSESSEFFYFYYLHWKFLIHNKNHDLEKINCIETFLMNLRENDAENGNYGLFYERMILENDQISGKMTRGIVLGTVARFLAHYYLLSGKELILNHLKVLLDQMVNVGLVIPQTGELNFYNPINGKVGVNPELPNSYFHGYNKEDIVQNNKDTNIKNSYIIEGYILGYTLTRDKKYLDIAINITDWLIENNYDENSKSFPNTSAHDTMEFFEALWNLFLVTQNKKYYNLLRDSISLFFDLRYHGKLIPFRYFINDNNIYSYDTLTPTQMFLAEKLEIWGEEGFSKTNRDMLAYLYSIRESSCGNYNHFSKLKNEIIFKLKGINWKKAYLDTNQCWNFRYSSISNNKVFDEWSPDGNFMSFNLTYLLKNLYSIKFGALISIYLGKYYPGQPYIAFTSGKITSFNSNKSKVEIIFDSHKNFNIILIMPKWGDNYDIFIDDKKMEDINCISDNSYAKVININLKNGRRKLKAELFQ